MKFVPENPLIVQADLSLLLETMNPHFSEVRDALARFAELLKSPDYMHTWRVTPLSLWNAAAAGVTVDEVLGALDRWSRYDVPPSVPVSVRETMARWGRLKLVREGATLLLVAEAPLLMTEIRGTRAVSSLLGRARDNRTSEVPTGERGVLKQVLLQHGHPVQDLAGYVDGDLLAVALREDGGPGWRLGA